jgi:hypothetical protein
MSQAVAKDNNDTCLANADNANSPEQRAQVLARCAGQLSIQSSADPSAALAAAIRNPQPTPQQSSGSGGGRLAFTSSRGTNALQVGDTWLVSITGANANQPVAASGSMPSGAFNNTPMGSTDASGNFSKSGTVGPGDIGAWSESWYVGAFPSGQFSFTVAPATPPVPGVLQGGSPAPVPSVPVPGAGGSTTFVLPTVGGFDLSRVPWWGWAGAAAAAYFMFGQGGRR